MLSGTLGVRCTKKIILLCTSLPELCVVHQDIWFFNHTTDFAEKQGLPVVYYPKKWIKNS